jgi:DNA processing protein
VAPAVHPAPRRTGGLSMLGVGAGPQSSDGGEHVAPATPPAAAFRSDARLGDVDRDALAVLLSVNGMGPLTLARLVERLGSPAAILEAAAGTDGARALLESSRAADGEWRTMPKAVAAAIAAAAGDRARLLAEVRRSGLRVVARGDGDYPSRLLGIDIPPPALFVRGSLASLGSAHVVAVVGTRRPSPAGRRIASRLATALVRAGATVVSGLAVGIDGAAHAACVTDDAPTVAFIGGGHARLFPKAHDRLADAIVEGGGAVASEYAPTVEPTKGTFPQRNRLISGSADAVVVVEAGARSGALVTASWALEQGRECFLVPGSIDSPMSAGCNGFLRDWHGLARIVSGIPQLLDDLGLLAAAGLPATRAAGGRSGGIVSSRVTLPSPSAVLSGRDAAQVAVAEALVHGAVIVDELVAVTRLSVGAVLGALTRLEAAGLARPIHGRYEPIGALAAADPKAA